MPPKIEAPPACRAPMADTIEAHHRVQMERVALLKAMNASITAANARGDRRVCVWGGGGYSIFTSCLLLCLTCSADPVDLLCECTQRRGAVLRLLLPYQPAPYPSPNTGSEVCLIRCILGMYL